MLGMCLHQDMITGVTVMWSRVMTTRDKAAARRQELEPVYSVRYSYTEPVTGDQLTVH